MRLNVLKICAHLNIVLAVMFAVFAVITAQNTSMGFMTDGMSLSLLHVFCFAALLLVILFAFEVSGLRHSRKTVEVFGLKLKGVKTANTVFLCGYIEMAFTFALSIVFIALALISAAIGPDEIMNSVKTVYAMILFSLADGLLAGTALFVARKIERAEIKNSSFEEI